MAERFLQKVTNTNQILGKPTAAGVGVKSGNAYLHNGTAVMPLVQSAVTGTPRVASGEIALDGTNPTTVATGLSTIVAGIAVLKGTAAPGVGTSVLTVNFAGTDGNLDIYAWKPTSNANPTLIASTGTETVEWIAFGT